MYFFVFIFRSWSPKLIVPWAACVGLGSFYFHGTLSLLGQFTDEILLIWILLLTFIFALPSHYMLGMTRKNFQLCLVIYGICLTCSWFINTAVFAFWIVPMGFPIIGVVFVEAYRCKYQPLRVVALLANVVNVAVVLCWFVDRWDLFCAGSLTGETCSVLVHWQVRLVLCWFIDMWDLFCAGSLTGETCSVLVHWHVRLILCWFIDRWDLFCAVSLTGETYSVLVHWQVRLILCWFIDRWDLFCVGSLTGETCSVLVHWQVRLPS